MNIEKTTERHSSPPSEGQPYYVMYPSAEDNGIDLIALAGLTWKRKWLIAAITFLFAIAGLFYSFVATPVYQAEGVLVPNISEQGPNLSGGLGGLADIAGINLGISPDTTDSVATLRSRVFVEEFIQEKNLMPVLFSDEWDAVNEHWIAEDPEEWPDIRDGITFFTEEIRTIHEDPTTGIITLSIQWKDPELAANWAESFIRQINDKLRLRDLSDSEKRLAYLNTQLENASLIELRQAISRLIENEIQVMMLADSDMEYAFKVIDPPRAPKEAVFPRTLPIVFFAALLGGLISMSYVLVSGWSRIVRHEVASHERD